VDVTPACGKAVVIRNEAKTVKGRTNGAAVGTRSAGRQTEVVIKGSVGLSGKLVGSGRRRVADATYFAAGVWRAVLEERGIAVDGETVFAKASAELPVVATRKSPTLQKIVTVTNKTSHNGYAETLFKLSAVAHGHAPATAETAEASARKALDGLGIRWEGVKLGNGSGLYHANQVTCRAVVDLLRGMAKDSTGANYRQSLAMGGVDGTLRGRLHGAMKGRVQAKTGTLDDVVGLAGYLQAPDRGYVFAMFFNRVKGSPGPLRATQDRVLRRLSGQ
jgi:D-alanyl-D-alanine carboxypeptidase/D-alanyl-D-alanine-endopeptidase (penicillin-binding protein 4)